MKPGAPILKDETGSVMVIALLMLALLTIIGISSSTTSQIEIQIAGNDRFHKIAFYNADSGVYTAPKLISSCIDDGSAQGINTGGYTPDDGTFYREVMGYDTYDAATDIQFLLGGFAVDVDVDRTGQKTMPGGSAEFASAAEGVGVGSAGAVGIFYNLDSFGNGPGSSRSNVGAVYRKVVGVAGGL